ncbi:MAG: histidine kinase N-terminal 7TM domain-containing protein [Haloarculaceae archaeon]
MVVLANPIVALGLLSTAAAVAIAAISWLNRESRGARVYAVLMSVLAVWSTLYVVQVLQPTVGAKYPWLAARHAISPFVPLLFWIFAARYTDESRLLGRRYVVPYLLAGVVIATIVVVNPAHLYWATLRLAPSGRLRLVSIAFGPAFWINIVFVFGVTGWGHKYIVDTFLDSFAVHRAQLAAMTVAGIFEFGLLVLFLTDHVSFVPALNPWPNVQLITYGATIVALPLGWSYFNAELFALQPLARQTVIENMEDAVLVFDAEDTVINANDRAKAMLDVPGADSLEGEQFADVFADLPEIRERFLHTEDIEEELALELDGETRYYDLKISPLTSTTGEHVGRVIVGRDITTQKRRSQKLGERTRELQRKTEELQRQNERLDDFASFVSHDLRNPLSVARGNLELARETGDEERFEKAAGALDRMERMIDDLLTLARQGGELDDVEALEITDVAADAWSHVDTREADLRTDGTGVVGADRGRLLHVFENLFRNAIEHGGEDVTVTVGPLSDGADGFYVADDGPGIPADEREDVFEHGYTTSEGGSGFGMSIVQEIVDIHGWTVAAAESERGGARFEFATDAEE